MEGKGKCHDLSFEDFKPQKVNRKIKHENEVGRKGTIKSLSNKESTAKASTVCSTITCVVCNASIQKGEMDHHLPSCMEKYKHCKEKEDENKAITGKRREKFSCFICNQIITSLSIQQREQHVNSCLNKQEAKRKWEEVGLSQNRKRPRKSIVMDCPLCGQGFHSSEARYTHLKACSTKHNMNTKQLIEAVRLQEKHAKERKEAGLPEVTSNSSRTVLRKSNRQKSCKPKQPKDKNEEDLQTALALSASLTECMNNKMTKELDAEHSDNTALEFMSNAEHRHVMRLHPRHERKPPKKKELKSRSTPLLLLRKEEERLKLLEERVSNLLNTETPAYCRRKCTEKDVPNKLYNRRHTTISDISVNGCPLWSSSSKQDVMQNEFYVSSLRDLVSPSKVQAGSKLRRLSQIPGSSLSQKLPVCVSLQFNEKDVAKHEISTQECIDVVLEDEEELSKDENKMEVGGFCFPKQESNLSFEQNCETYSNMKASLKLAMMFRSLVGKKDFSDISVFTEDKRIPAHSLIFNVRCPDIMKDTKPSSFKNSEATLDWGDISSDAAFAFLEVIYSGNTSSQLPNKEDIKKLVYRYNAQHIFEDLLMFLEIEPKQSKLGGSDVLNGIWRNYSNSKSFQNNTVSNAGSQDTSDTDELDSVYLYLSQKQHNDKELKYKEAEKDEEDVGSFKFSENGHGFSDISVCALQQDHKNKNGSLYVKNESCDKLNCENTDDDSTTCELPVLISKDISINSSNNSSPDLFDSESDTETKLSKSINKLKRIDLKEESLPQGKGSNSLALLEDSPYHFSEEDNFYQEKYSSPFKRFRRKKSLEVSEKFELNSPVKSFQEDKMDIIVNSKRTSLKEQINSVNSLTPTKTQYIHNKCSQKNIQEKSSPHKTKNSFKEVTCYNSPSQTKFSPPHSPFSQKQITSSMKKLPRKYTEILNNSQNVNNECDDIWDDFHDNGYNEFIADFGMNDNSYDNDYIIESQITEKMSTSIEIAANALVNEMEKSYKLPSPSPNSEKSLLYDSPVENKKRNSPSHWMKNGVKEDSHAKVKASPPNKKAKVKNDVTPMPNYSQMITPELKQHCTKYGVKKLPRKKAVAMLTHIYEETHPFVTDSEYDTSVTSTPRNPAPHFSTKANSKRVDEKQEFYKPEKHKPSEKLKQPKKKLTRTNLLQKIDESKEAKTVASSVKFSQQNISKCSSSYGSEKISDANLDEQPSSQTSSQSETSDILEESLIVETESSSQDEQNTHKKLQAYIQQNVDLYGKVLKYEPINLTEFHKNIKESGIKVSTAKVIDFFDEQCITFSIPRDEKTKEKQQKRTKRYQKRRAGAIAKQKYSSTQ